MVPAADIQYQLKLTLYIPLPSLSQVYLGIGLEIVDENAQEKDIILSPLLRGAWLSFLSSSSKKIWEFVRFVG